MNKNLYAVILAGGAGTRFWPKSRKSLPKQFIDVTGEGTFFDQTIKRIKPIVPLKNIWVVSNANYKKLVVDSLRKFKIPTGNILLEPSGKNTAPAICWAASVLFHENPDAIMMVLPSDHLITREKNFINMLNKAVKTAGQDYLVTMGIVPTRPEVGYGYFKVKRGKNKDVLLVDKFIEKPDVKKAAKLICNKNVFWNSGMFVWKAKTVLKEFLQHLPKTYKLFAELKDPKKVLKIWDKVESISVDYAIMEKSGRVAAVAAENIGWSDVGSWQALSEILPSDKQGNYFKGEVLGIDNQNTMVWADKRLVVAVGLKNIVIVDTKDAVLVCDLAQSQKIKNVVDALKVDKKFRGIV
ncbi:MAG: mannose-1-phosphate guanylyltransferase [Candidatus Omnitrophica bacterium]|nr:mannose-1-phosphate guanylyltransferase [Candidatus Omnitrophota bacterium]